MSLSNPIIHYGIHSGAFYRPADGTFYGCLQVLGGVNFEFSAETEDLYGGSSKFAWASEDKIINSSFTTTVKQYEDFMWELFLGATVTLTSAETSGNITTPVEVKGTSIMGATTGIASIAITTAADAKMGKYVIVADTDDDLSIYCSTNIDFAKGADADYVNDALKVATVALGDNSDVQAVAGLGISITGGSGTIAFTPGDTATFYIRPINTAARVIDVGALQSTFPEFGVVFMAQKRKTFEMFEIEAYKCQGSGLPINLQEGAFAISDLTAKCLIDLSKNKVLTLREVKAAA